MNDLLSIRCALVLQLISNRYSVSAYHWLFQCRKIHCGYSIRMKPVCWFSIFKCKNSCFYYTLQLQAHLIAYKINDINKSVLEDLWIDVEYCLNCVSLNHLTLLWSALEFVVFFWKKVRVDAMGLMGLLICTTERSRQIPSKMHSDIWAMSAWPLLLLLFPLLAAGMDVAPSQFHKTVVKRIFCLLKKSSANVDCWLLLSRFISSFISR